MATGIRTLLMGQGHTQVFGTLVESAVGTTTGTWLRLEGKYPCSVTAEGTFVGTVQVFASNQETKPADADSARLKIGEDIVDGSGSAIINGPYLWIKAAVTAYSSGTINVFLYGKPVEP